jgi:hypothetical protein
MNDWFEKTNALLYYKVDGLMNDLVGLMDEMPTRLDMLNYHTTIVGNLEVVTEKGII